MSGARCTATTPAIWVLLILVGVLVPRAVSAQRVAQHRGFWISFGPGYGGTFSDPEAGASGLALFVRLGGSPSQQVLVGADLTVWGDNEAVRSQTGAAVRYYPSASGGAFVRATLGLARREISQSAIVDVGMGPVFTTLDIVHVGVGLGVGAGYDVQLGSNFFLTPGIDLYAQRTDEDWAGGLLFLLAATWH